MRSHQFLKSHPSPLSVVLGDVWRWCSFLVVEHVCWSEAWLNVNQPSRSSLRKLKISDLIVKGSSKARTGVSGRKPSPPQPKK